MQDNTIPRTVLEGEEWRDGILGFFYSSIVQDAPGDVYRAGDCGPTSPRLPRLGRPARRAGGVQGGAAIASATPKAPLTRHFVDEGVPVIRGSNLSTEVGVRLKDEGLAFLTTEKARTLHRSMARRGDLGFTCWGTVGQIGYIDDRARYDCYVVSNKQMKLTPDSPASNNRDPYTD